MAATMWITGTKNWSDFCLSAYPLKAMTIEKVCITINAREIIAVQKRKQVRLKSELSHSIENWACNSRKFNKFEGPTTVKTQKVFQN